MVRIVVSDHLVIAGLILIGLWLDAARRKWCLKSQLWQGRGVRGAGFDVVGYLAGRLGNLSNSRA
jgi:hypothetical protein